MKHFISYLILVSSLLVLGYGFSRQSVKLHKLERELENCINEEEFDTSFEVDYNTSFWHEKERGE